MLQPPKELVELQDWFSKGLLESTHLESVCDEDDVATHITPSDKMSPKERYDVYIRDYWPRCLDSLKDDFSSLWHHWGKKRFKIWMTRYLRAYPSRSFTLYHLGQDVMTFYEETYRETDRPFVLAAIAFDWAKMVASFSENKPALDPSQFEESQLSTLTMCLQKHVTLLNLPFNFYKWSEKNYPSSGPKEMDTAYLVRQKDGKVSVNYLSQEQVTILLAIQQEGSIESAMTVLPEETSISILQETLSLAIAEQLFIHPEL